MTIITSFKGNKHHCISLQRSCMFALWLFYCKKTLRWWVRLVRFIARWNEERLSLTVLWTTLWYCRFIRCFLSQFWCVVVVVVIVVVVIVQRYPHRFVNILYLYDIPSCITPATTNRLYERRTLTAALRCIMPLKAPVRLASFLDIDSITSTFSSHCVGSHYYYYFKLTIIGSFYWVFQSDSSCHFTATASD